MGCLHVCTIDESSSTEALQRSVSPAVAGRGPHGVGPCHVKKATSLPCIGTFRRPVAWQMGLSLSKEFAWRRCVAPPSSPPRRDPSARAAEVTRSSTASAIPRHVVVRPRARPPAPGVLERRDQRGTGLTSCSAARRSVPRPTLRAGALGDIDRALGGRGPRTSSQTPTAKKVDDARAMDVPGLEPVVAGGRAGQCSKRKESIRRDRHYPATDHIPRGRREPTSWVVQPRADPGCRRRTRALQHHRHPG